ncbi:leucine-rich repeat domain superfamily [Holotrichia oblita]|uniref:Leucine-rich repeat domain superfamily n=1 Tax=Holotrichia oblita TaxID=644536 RepID=A0ACB9T0W0_HOLOL|nr:leucine-rich repeat domain superfamily [Holotrichia oblita]
MNSLTTLWLERNKLRSITINEDSDPLPALKVLDMIENNLKSFDYKLLDEKLPNIQDILIGKNRWNCDFLVKMYNYYSVRNVSVCLDARCNASETDYFIRVNCSNVNFHATKGRDNPDETTGIIEDDEGDTEQNDFVLDSDVSSSGHFDISKILLTALVVVLFLSII